MNFIVDVLKDVPLWNSLCLEHPNLTGANLAYATLSCSNLAYANLSDANLSRSNLRSAGLSDANLSRSNLTGANLPRSNLTGANLRSANLSRANLTYANLTYANLTGANLRGADLAYANLSRSNLTGANLTGANLSGAIGLPSAEEFLAQFPYDADGIIVFRAEKGERSHPSSWSFSPGCILEEIPNPDRSTVCGCGVAFATEKWVRTQYPQATVWKCRIWWPWLADVVVPFNTDGKARTRKLELIEKL